MTTRWRTGTKTTSLAADDEDNHWEAQPTCELAMKEEEDPRNPSPQALNLAHMVAQNFNELPTYGIQQATKPMYDVPPVCHWPCHLILSYTKPSTKLTNCHLPYLHVSSHFFLCKSCESSPHVPSPALKFELMPLAMAFNI